ncbi:TetR/AcrR family transcriptional regulator [Actinoplanes sp. G11-F43]|uniref:TetR/AcrR family transcriptional regulator n=1 Tax=Actinoplanes sp. G11-F43 TaxID=3424130 RepID=UPI003D350356
MPDSSRPLRADAARNRLKVIEAAERVLAKDGAAASMRDIAGRAGVGLATVYRQFPTKESLFEAIVAERVARLLARARMDAEDPGAAFAEFVTFAVEESTGERALAEAGHDALWETVGTLLRRAQDAGRIRPDARVDEVFALITALCLTADRQQWDEELRTRTLAIVFDGLRISGCWPT